MKTTLTLIQIQQNAIDAILCARTQGKRASAFGMTTLNKSPRVIRGIRKNYWQLASRFGFSAEQVAAQWGDVKDMAVLEANCEA